MGCTPSIQVNQTDVVYRRDYSTSPVATQSATLISGVTVVRTDKSETSHSSDSDKLKMKGKRRKDQSHTFEEKVRCIFNTTPTCATSLYVSVFLVTIGLAAKDQTGLRSLARALTHTG